MVLKKLPKDMSYEAVRYKHPATPNHASDSTSSEKATAAVDPSDRPQDDHGSHPGDAALPVVETSAGPRQESVSVDRPAPERKPASRSAVGQRTTTDKSVRVRGYVYVPAIGENQDFDELREIYGEKEALALALSHGMTSYGAALREAGSLEPLPRLDRGRKRIEASRSIAHDLYPKAVDHLDPKKMLGQSQMGSRILEAALAYYLRKK